MQRYIFFLKKTNYSSRFFIFSLKCGSVTMSCTMTATQNTMNQPNISDIVILIEIHLSHIGTTAIILADVVSDNQRHANLSNQLVEGLLDASQGLTA